MVTTEGEKKEKTARKRSNGEKRVRKDPFIPKKPQSPYTLFQHEFYLQHKDDINEDTSQKYTFSEMGQLTGLAWRNTSDEDKKEWEKKHAQAMIKYFKELARYNNKIKSEVGISEEPPTKKQKNSIKSSAKEEEEEPDNKIIVHKKPKPEKKEEKKQEVEEEPEVQEITPDENEDENENNQQEEAQEDEQEEQPQEQEEQPEEQEEQPEEQEQEEQEVPTQPVRSSSKFKPALAPITPTKSGKENGQQPKLQKTSSTIKEQPSKSIIQQKLLVEEEETQAFEPDQISQHESQETKKRRKKKKKHSGELISSQESTEI